MISQSVLPMIAVIFLYFGYLLLPGYLVLLLAKVKRHRFLLGYGISFSLLVISQIPIRILGGSPAFWFFLLHLFIGLALLISWLFGRNRNIPVIKKKSHMRVSVRSLGITLGVIGFSVYHLIVGPYTEIPSDFWIHLGDSWKQLIEMKKGFLPGSGLGISELADGNYVSFLHAVAAYFFQSNPLWLVPGVTMVTSAIFLISTYWFVLRIISNVRISSELKVAIAVLTCILTVFSFGVATFSYVRYYAYFHSIFNFPLIYLSIILLIDYLERPKSNTSKLFLIVLLLCIMVLVHKQEALYSLIIIFGITTWKLIRGSFQKNNISLILWRRISMLGYMMIGMVPFILIYTFLKWDLGMPDSDSTVVIDASHFLPFTRELPITNPSLRFWDVLAVFGVVVYSWYFLRRRWFAGLDYINIGMASPLLTLFNPIFVIWFLHIMTADVLWRMSYLMPLSLVAAFLIVYSFSKAYKAKNRRAFSFATLMTLIVLCSLFPFDFHYIYNSNSRLPSLYSVHSKNGANLWSDLIRATEKIGGRRVILADGVTRYVLSNSTPHTQGVGGKELWRYERVPEFLNRPHKNNPKKNLRAFQQTGDLLVINKIDGSPSENGRRSGHWPEDILLVSDFYPNDLAEYASAKGKGSKWFIKLYSSDRLWIYEIR
tara:strand:- start:3364 stop:5331 length:1968 start_codon:yes stop_codon:yes gene_type:complete